MAKVKHDLLYDCIVIGGGPAGLSAALMLARYGRKAVTFHDGAPRNAHAHGIHGFLGHDGIQPEQLLELGRAEVQRYGGLIVARSVQAVQRREDEFVVHAGELYRTRCLLLATGLRDIPPPIPGFLDFYGTSIHHCPDCDGFEMRDKRVAVLGTGHAAIGLLKALRVWTTHLTMLTNGEPNQLDQSDRESIETMQVPILSEKVAAFEGDVGSRRIRTVRFVDGQFMSCDAVFFALGTVPATTFHESLGCVTELETGLVHVGPDQQTSVRGVYAAGDITPLSHMAVMAAAEGAVAAIHIHKFLLKEFDSR